uniref:Dynein regulatory complex subunit 4 n=1 Tax=Oncorhynchus tshawytscha TaxID=74940 RepID=A0A8C8FX17_ONCTS
MERLEEHIVRLREELDREREERNYFQLERDKIHTFWKITKRHLDERKADLRNRDRYAIVYKQKVKHLLYEHQNSISELKGEGVVSNKLMQKEHAELENELCKGMRNLKKNDQEITKTRNYFERQVREIEAKYETKMQMLRQEQDLRRKTEIEERKNSQINTLMKNHEKAFSDIKNYYNDITLNNLSLINSLKASNTTTISANKAKEEVTELQKQLANYEKDKTSLTGAKARLKVADKEMKDLKWEHEVLEQRFSKVQVERDDLYKKFTQAIQEVQQKSGFMNLLLERKLGALTNTLEKKEAQLNALVVVTRKLEVCYPPWDT